MKKEQSIGFIIFQRTMYLPFVVGIAVVAGLILSGRCIISYGGEFTPYSKQVNRKTFGDVFALLSEIHLQTIAKCQCKNKKLKTESQ